MTEEELSKIKALMADLIEELHTQIASLEVSTRPIAPDNAIGRLTRMEAITAKGVSEASLTSARTRLTRLQNTLKRADREDFGLCSVCKEPIPLKRLMLLPDTVRCMQCASS